LTRILKSEKGNPLQYIIAWFFSLKILTENCLSPLKNFLAEVTMTEALASILKSEKAVSGHTESPDVISQTLKTYLVRLSLFKIPTKDFIMKY
jgi:hypothetical protein